MTWLNDPLGSKHVTGKAVDLVPYPLDWNDLTKFKKIADAMKQAAIELNIRIEWVVIGQKPKTTLILRYKYLNYLMELSIIFYLEKALLHKAF